ncbi:hypothetical protein H8K90_01800 [Winogradskyella echinorum]|uniref:Uncharacterized protein n=1 Tax=Winogradskyella echinorum TaxID=538189 RepID=A0ABR6XX99_9FLAO|nr:hypothetical protein [Winogradskyella echinorum]MBC3845100.1 hypothetical protein [Winogradskyella echinorum]MBC5749448.1 hypothetical protein [Winogradskyella echinorum]
MRKIGTYMVIFGALAIVLNFFDRVPTILMWIYSWGDTAAWGIKIGLIVVGAILFFVGKPTIEDDVKTVEESAE